MSEKVEFLAQVHPTATWLGMNAERQTKLVLSVSPEDVAQMVRLIMWTDKRLRVTMEVDGE